MNYILMGSLVPLLFSIKHKVLTTFLYVTLAVVSVYTFLHQQVELDALSVNFAVIACIIGFVGLINATYEFEFKLLVLTNFSLLLAFTTASFLLFYIAFEICLVALFILIGKYGTKGISAAKYMFMYNFAASMFMFCGIVWFYIQSQSFNFTALYQLDFTKTGNILALVLVVLGLMIKLPLWPFHSWLPKAHTKASTCVSMVLAALVLKLGGYGLIRLLSFIPILPKYLVDIGLGLGLLTMLVIGVNTIMQDHLKKLIAYSSINHMGFACAGLFLGLINENFASAIQGSLYAFLAHSFTSAGLFLLGGIIYKIYQSYEFKHIQGLMQVHPGLAWVLMLFCMANLGLPGTFNFVGEMLIILAACKHSVALGLIFGLNLVLSALFSLKIIYYVVFGTSQLSFTLAKTQSFSLLILTLGLLLGLFPRIIAL